MPINTMGLFKKKEGIPTIPTSSSLPPLPSISDEPIKRDLPGLPSFPTGFKNTNLNQEMVKSAVSDMPSPEEEEEYAEAPESFNVEEEPEEELKNFQRPLIRSSIPEPPKPILPSKPKPVRLQIPPAPVVPTHLPQSPIPNLRTNEPIFIRIDKFQAAQKNFEEIKSKITEMESVLQKIIEVKAQEEEELKGWTEDVEKLKIRLSEIDSNIFSQL